MLPGSTAIERPGVSGTPCAPRGPSCGSGSGSSRKKTNRGLLHSNSSMRFGLRWAQARIAGFNAKSNESLTLIARGSGTAFETAWKEFTLKVAG